MGKKTLKILTNFILLFIFFTGFGCLGDSSGNTVEPTKETNTNTTGGTGISGDTTGDTTINGDSAVVYVTTNVIDTTIVSDTTVSTVKFGTIVLQSMVVNNFSEGYNGFIFSSSLKTTETAVPGTDINADFAITGNMGRLKSGVEIIDLGITGIDSVSVVPVSGYVNYFNAYEGHSYVIKLTGPKYAVIEITSHVKTGMYASTSNIRFKYQTNGSRDF